MLITEMSSPSAQTNSRSVRRKRASGSHIKLILIYIVSIVTNNIFFELMY